MLTSSKHPPNRVGIRNSTDYSPFGVELDGRTVNVDGYRFGYQGSEKDNEFKGNGNSYTTEFRQYDPRIGRWLSLDPKMGKYPGASPYIVNNNNPNLFIDPNGDDWYLPKSGKEKGTFKWIDGKAEVEGHTRIGEYKVEYDKEKNALNVYHGKESKFIETISMETKDGKYLDDRAAKFALISAETGGVNVKENNPFFDPLIISASIDNRQKVADAGNPRLISSTNQEYKGYYAKKYESYSDFKYGNKQRFNGNKYFENLSYATVYYSLDKPVVKLQNYYNVKQANYILYYSHTGGSPQGGTAFNITYPSGYSTRFVSVQGDTKYKKILDVEEEKKD
jgi:RHS repeat-associated protein